MVTPQTGQETVFYHDYSDGVTTLAMGLQGEGRKDDKHAQTWRW